MAEEKNLDLESKRSFIGPEDKTYYIDIPTAEDVRSADWQYSKMYTKCLMEDIPTSAEMIDILTRRGIIGPEFEQRASELAQNLASAIAALEASEDVNQKRSLAYKVAAAREELFQWNQRLNGPMNNTAEQMSDDARLECLAASIVKDDKLEKVWPNFTAYLNEKNQGLALKSRFEVMLYLQGLESDFIERTPEAKAIREVEADLLEKARDALNAADVLAEEEKEEVPAVEVAVEPVPEENIAEDTGKKKPTGKKKKS